AAGPTRAATRASGKAAATAQGKSRKGAASTARPGASPPGARPTRRRRRWPVLLVALLVLAVLGGAGAVWGPGLLGDRSDGPVAEQVPDAVLPDLVEPAPALAELSAQAPVPDPAVLAGMLTPLLEEPALGTGLSARVVDVATGDVLFDRAGTDPGTPASTTKLLTAMAVLTSLDPESTLTTRVVAGSTPGEVVLVGGGDPTLSTTDPSRTYPGAATVADLADQVRAQLAGTPITRVVVDNSLFSGPLTAPGWQPDDAPSTYAAPVTAAAVDGARVNPAGSPRSGQPGIDAGTALAAALGVPSAEVVLGTAPAGARTLGTVESAPIQRLVEQALTQSDNLLSESLARHVALARGLPPTFAGAAQAVTDAVADAGLDTTGLSLADASGLSDRDRAPARLLVDALRAASDGTAPEAAGLLAGLPIAGYTGTLADRTVEGAVPGSVRAKTGTLRSVHDLAGTVVTADGRLLAFAVLADGTTGSPAAAETALDVVAATLAGCGCR
ncbi:D-alanyl-D-alanine carboxypeptidase/D-alanyl-D-alanine endopeptidase, partial [Modestobacter lapidis]